MRLQHVPTPGPDVLRLLGLAADRAADGASLADMLRGCAVFTLDEGAGPLAAFAVERWGDSINCTALGGVPGVRSLVPAVVEAGERIARAAGADRMTCTTARPGLVRQLKAHGFHVAGWIMER